MSGSCKELALFVKGREEGLGGVSVFKTAVAEMKRKWRIESFHFLKSSSAVNM